MSKLRLYGDTSGYLDVKAPDTADNSTLDLSTVVKEDVSGNVGIGTSSPTKPLHIYGNSENNHQIRLQNDFGSGSDWTLNAYGANGNLYISNNLDRLVIDASGRVTMPYQPSFHAKGTPSVNNSILYYGTGDANAAVIHNVGGHYSTSTGRFTAPINGRYFISIMWCSVRTTASADYYADIKINGTIQQRCYAGKGTANYHAQGWGSVILELNVNDYVDIHYSGQANTLADPNHSYFSGHLVG